MNSTLLKSLIFLPILLLGTISDPGLEKTGKADQPDTFVVVLDAGHGGHDPGNLGNGYQEKNIALSIVLAAGAILEKKQDIKVVYTRKDDSFVDLFVRGEIANKANADIFVSVHCDAFRSPDPYGATTFVLGLHANEQNFEIAKKENSVIYLEDNYETRYAEYDINSPESIIGLTIMQEEFLEKSIVLARKMQQTFGGKLKRKDRKVKQAGFIVLHQTFMPSVLIETGFLTNRQEGAYLNSKKGQLDMGKAIAEAILSYRDEMVPKVAEGYTEQDFANAPSTPPPLVNRDEEKQEAEAVDEEDKTEQASNDKEPVGPERSPTLDKELKSATPIEVAQKNPDATPDMAQTEEGQAETENTADLSQKKIESEPEQKGVIKSSEPEIIPEPQPILVKEKKSDITYRVQIMASTKRLQLDPSNFKGLNNLSREQFKQFHRYMYGNTTSYDQVKLFKANADAKGYTTSFIVAYKDGERIAIQEALAYQKGE